MGLGCYRKIALGYSKTSKITPELSPQKYSADVQQDFIYVMCN